MKKTASTRKGLAVFSWVQSDFWSRKFQQDTLFLKEHKGFLFSKKLCLLPETFNR
jgi:hypothetical protein